MADTRIFQLRQSWRNYEWTNVTDAHLRAELEIKRFRDDLRAKFSDVRYKVSDIAKWAGSSGCFGYAFVLRDDTFSHEILFGFFARSTGSAAYLIQSWGNNSGATLGSYFKIFSGTALSDPGFSSGCCLIHYNHDTASSYAMGFDTANLTYNSGDFQAPASSPFSAISSFMPASKLRGIDLTNWMGDTYSKASLMYDPDIGVFRFDHTNGPIEVTRLAWFAGVIYPLNSDGGLSSATDTNQKGCLVVQMVGALQNTMNNALNASKVFCQFLRENGTLENEGYIANALSAFTRASYRTAGEIEFRKMRVEVGAPAAYVKGYINPAILCEALPFNDYAFKYYRFTIPGHADKPLMKEHSNLCLMWKKDLPFITQMPDLITWTG